VQTSYINHSKRNDNIWREWKINFRLNIKLFELEIKLIKNIQNMLVLDYHIQTQNLYCLKIIGYMNRMKD
jgi:hypothetical protein